MADTRGGRRPATARRRGRARSRSPAAFGIQKLKASKSPRRVPARLRGDTTAALAAATPIRAQLTQLDDHGEGPRDWTTTASASGSASRPSHRQATIVIPDDREQQAEALAGAEDEPERREDADRGPADEVARPSEPGSPAEAFATPTAREERIPHRGDQDLAASSPSSVTSPHRSIFRSVHVGREADLTAVVKALRPPRRPGRRSPTRPCGASAVDARQERELEGEDRAVLVPSGHDDGVRGVPAE